MNEKSIGEKPVGAGPVACGSPVFVGVGLTVGFGVGLGVGFFVGFAVGLGGAVLWDTVGDGEPEGNAASFPLAEQPTTRSRASAGMAIRRRGMRGIMPGPSRFR
jgi:hypothetical protein